MKPSEFETRMHRAANEIAKPQSLMQDIVLIAEAEAKKQASSGPNKAIKTGTWRRSITGRVITPTRGVVGSNISYGPYVELGTKYMRARPAIHDGIQAARPKIIERARVYGVKVFEKVAKG